MKQIKTWLLATIAVLATVSFTACSDDDKPNVIDSEIVGTWVNEGYDWEEVLTFSSNGIYTMTWEEMDDKGGESGTYSIEGNKITIKCAKITGSDGNISEYVGETNTFTWSVSGSRLNIDGIYYTKK